MELARLGRSRIHLPGLGGPRVVVRQRRIRGGEPSGSAHLDFLGQLRSSILEMSGPGARSQCSWGVSLEL